MKVAELREKLAEYDGDETVAVRMDVPATADVHTDLAERVYRTRRGLVVIEGADS